MVEENGVEVHEAFKGAGEKPGLETWRIEQFNPVKQPTSNDGTFYNGDAYIILSTKEIPGRSKYEHNLHFWLGKHCEQDKSGSAALLTVELDTYALGGAAIQYREVQSHESKLFLSYYKSGIKVKEGGVDSGFNKVDHDAYVKALYQVKGHNNIRVEQVECKCGSLNQSDVFVLDDGPNIYVWVGPNSGKKTQCAGVEVARAIRDQERGGRGHIHIVDDDWDTNDEFFRALGSRDKTIKVADTTSDEDIVRKLDQELLLFQITEKNQNAKDWAEINEVATRPLSQNLLKADKCFALDSGYSGLYIWTGKKCSNSFKNKVWTAANQFLEQRGYPDWMSIVRCVDGGEPPMFKQYFNDWKDSYPGEGEEQKSNVAGQDYTGASGVDMGGLHKSAGKAEEWMPDDGSGKITIYRVGIGNEIEQIPDYAHGVFFGEDCYVMQYEYKSKSVDSYIIYFWQGLKATTDSKGASAAWAVTLDNQLHGQAIQMRVVMNKEPAHFMAIFKGKIAVFMGGSAAGYRGPGDYVGYNPKDAYMFDIRSNGPNNTKAIQVDCRGSSLNSNAIFIVDSPDKVYAWIGKNSDENDIEVAKAIVDILSPIKGEPTVVKEGSETGAFWSAIGGEEAYYTGPKATKSKVRIDPRLFQCSMLSGRFTVDEIVDYNQQDLDERDVMILDTFDEVFVWLGKDSREFEKQEAMKTAYAYLDSDPTGRTVDNTLIICVKMGFEPPQFTGCFHPWDPELWNQGKSFKELIDEVGQENAGINLLEDEVKKYTSNYPLDVLQRAVPPEGVDVTKKEMYLTDEDFSEVFGMTKEDYKQVPEWKRINLKKERGLF